MSAGTHQRYDLMTGRLRKTTNTPTTQCGVMYFVVNFHEKNGLYIDTNFYVSPYVSVMTYQQKKLNYLTWFRTRRRHVPFSDENRSKNLTEYF